VKRSTTALLAAQASSAFERNMAEKTPIAVSEIT
jgi:hypothetical protein